MNASSLRRLFISSVTCSLALCGCIAVSSADGDESIEIVKVEEVWELSVGAPNLERNAPQVSMMMCPLSHTNGQHFVFTLNHKTEPQYSAGGMQVLLKYGEQRTPVDTQNGPQGNELDVEDETITWTQSMSLHGGVVTFEVINGSSESWGSFGGQGYLRTSAQTGQANLNCYLPSVSLDESGIGYAGNRVVSLKLKTIRWTSSTGTVYTRNAPFDIDTDLDPWED